MDLNLAIQYAQLVNAAYAVDPNNLANAAGQVVNTNYAATAVAYKVVTTVYACDLATDMNPDRGNRKVSIGLILQSASRDVVIALRGTEGILEWIHDAQFLPVRCPFLQAAGNTDDGFTAMYESLATGADAGSSKLASALSALSFEKPLASLVVCGHSLGGAMATLLALDLTVNTDFGVPTVYTYASPRVGDSAFVNLYNRRVPDTLRIANRADLVPKLPLPPLYEHVLGLFELSSIELGITPKILIKPEIACEHYLSSYLYLLSRAAGGAALELDPRCVP
jgi:predicted lipase